VIGVADRRYRTERNYRKDNTSAKLTVRQYRIRCERHTAAVGGRQARQDHEKGRLLTVISFLHDLRFALRTFRTNPGFVTVAVLSLALGIGANTAIYTIYSSVFLRKLPVADTASLVEIYTSTPEDEIGMTHSVTSYPDYVDLREQSGDIFEDIITYNVGFIVYDGEEESHYTFGEEVSANYFDVLGVEAALGRTFIPEEEGVIGAAPTVVLGHVFWETRFGADPDIIGRTITLNGLDFTVIGVAPENFQGLFPIRADVFYPMTLITQLRPGDNLLESRGSRQLWMKGRLHEGVTIEEARAGVSVIAARLTAEYPESFEGHDFLLEPTDKVAFHPQLDGIISGFTITLMAVIGLVLLIACTNLASMLLARAVARRREIGIRLAIGAGRFRLIRQLVTESTLLAMLGGLGGLVLAWFLIRLLLAVQPPTIIPINLELGINGGVLLFTLLLSLGTGLIFGLLPAWQSTRPELTGSLKDDSGLLTGRLRKVGLRGILVTAQVAVSVVLLICAGLFLRSLGNASTVDPGFDIRDGVVATFELGEGGRYTGDESRAFFAEIVDRVTALPGVESAAVADRLPLGASIQIYDVYPITPLVEIDEDGVDVDAAAVGQGYFRTMGTPIVFGRAFTRADQPDTEPVVIVNETFARTYWPGESAIGRQVRLYDADGEARTIVGVARDGKYRSLGENQRPYIFTCATQANSFFVHLVVRTRTDGREFLQPVRSEIRALDRRVPIMELVTVPEQMQLMLFLPRTLASLLAGLGFFSLLLGTTGLYGVLAYDVSRRTREVGIRMAVGARQSEVLKLILIDGMKLVGTGIVIGLGLALLVTGALEGMLFAIDPRDPVTFAGVTVLFLAVSVAATLKPARKASRVDPIEALRTQ